MKPYFTPETCRLEKTYYAVLFPVVQSWEEAFWDDARPERQALTYSARIYAWMFLFRTLDPLVSDTLETLFRQDLAQANPILAWNAQRNFGTRRRVR